MSGFINEGMCISRDGINRYDIIDFPDMDSKIVANDRYFLYRNINNVIYTGEKGQFENINIPSTIRVSLNGEYLSFMTAPVVENGRTLVSVRFLFERMGATVTWNDSDKSCTISYNGKTVNVQIDNKTATVNGSPKELDVPAKLINDKTMLPLRFISEEFGFNVNWNEKTNTVEIKGV